MGAGTNFSGRLPEYMKVEKLSIKNIGLIADEVITLGQPLVLFYGQIRQGKTTILNAVRYVFGGAFPTDLLRHGEASGHIQLDFDCGYVRREFYRSDSGEIKARPVVFVQNGERVPRPVDHLKKFLNPFLLDQDHLTNKTELERKKFFAELFNTATPELDTEAGKLEQEARELRLQIKTYGDIQPVPVERVSEGELRHSLELVKTQNRSAVLEVERRMVEVNKHNALVKSNKEAYGEWCHRAEELRAQLSEAERTCSAAASWLDGNPVMESVPAATTVDTTALEEKISDARVTNVRAEQYEKDKGRLEQKQADERRVLEIERRLREVRDEKIARLDKISAECGVAGLKFVDNGEFIFEDTTPGMLSTSQIMRLSSCLSSLYPDDLHLGLVDRAESLGASVFALVERAKAEDKTILATIVGEKPAVVPEDVGVFIVENGKVKP
jgi:DNA repair ATPase RecN